MHTRLMRCLSSPVSQQGSTYQKKRTGPLVTASEGAGKHVQAFAHLEFLRDAKAHLASDLAEAIKVNVTLGPEQMMEFWRLRIRQIGTKKWRLPLLGKRAKVEGQVNLRPLAKMLGRMDMGGQLRVRQVTDGFPIAGKLGEPGVHTVDEKC